MKLPLDFGIPGLTALMRPKSATNAKLPTSATWTVAIVGPDGCGKSILALHLASRYWSDNCEPNYRPTKKSSEVLEQSPRVIYVSTDLSFEQAQGQWRSFGLDCPHHRKLALDAAYYHEDRRLREHRLGFPTNPLFSAERENPLDLVPLSPSAVPLADPPGNQGLEQFFDGTLPAVHFVDLQAQTAGDDWGFVNHLIGLLPKLKGTELPRHLLIIDAVEGLETFVGARDSFGQPRDRRSRVAQLIRNAARIGVHVVFIVEEPRPDARLPEQFVTDLVVRLRHPLEGTYTQRTIEIEKCRSFPHARGQHELGVRSGVGTFTGTVGHIDDPHVPWRAKTDDHLLSADESATLDPTDDPPYRCLAHVVVTESLHFWNRTVRELRSPIPEAKGYPTFGLKPLDDLLRTESPNQGSLTFLLGDAGTNKGRLSRCFLAHAFCESDGSFIEPEHKQGVAILISTRFIDHPLVVAKLASHLVSPDMFTYEDDRNARERLCDTRTAAVAGRIAPRVLCQRVSLRHVSSAAFLKMVATYIATAQQLVLSGVTSLEDVATRSWEDRRTVSHRIRLVIEDWNGILASHPNLSNDPLLLPSIVTLVKREGIAAVIVSTQPGQPHLSGNIDPHDLRHLDEAQIFTWNVPFFGERRVAVTALSLPATTRGPLIYELRPYEDWKRLLDDERIRIHRHFALYADVDRGAPARIPLILRLYGGNHPTDGTDGKEPQYSGFLRNTISQVFPSTPTLSEVVSFEPFTKYDGLFSFSDALDDAHLDHTLVFQVDEFWTADKSASLTDLSAYWQAEVSRPITNKVGQAVPGKFEWIREEDAYGMFQPHWPYATATTAFDVPTISSRHDRANREQDAFARWHMFLGPHDGGPMEHGRVKRVPYLWDFGMLLANVDLWSRNRQLDIPRSLIDPGCDATRVGRIWNSLALAKDRMSEREYPRHEYVPWDQFLAACKAIGDAENVAAFDVDLSTVESISCLLLELWASIEDDLRKDTKNGVLFNATARPYSPESEAETYIRLKQRYTLRRLVRRFPHSLFMALDVLVSTCNQLRSVRRVISRHHASPKCSASREWYHTSSAIARGNQGDRLTILRLPGHYSVRGDWSLAVAKGSRSELLAHRTIDLLSSRRMNLLRLLDGIGLPARDVLPDDEIGALPTALTRTEAEFGRVRALTYEEVCKCGADEKSDFFWLWRSHISQYGRDSFYLRRWIASMFEDQHDWLQSHFTAKQRAEFFDAIGRARRATGDLMEVPDLAEDDVLKEYAEQLAGFDSKRRLLLAALRDD